MADLRRRLSFGLILQRMTPETRYARSGDVSIAYQVVGDGPFDVVFVPPTVSHVELGWEVATMRTLAHGISSFARYIKFDKRGTGMSDRVSGAPTLETRMDDVRAVMDAAGSERAALLGWSEGVAMSVLFAATYPERAWALVLYGASARNLRAPDYPWGQTEGEAVRELEEQRTKSERPEFAEQLARSGMPAGTDEEVAELAHMLRQSASPGAWEALGRMNMQIDIRHVLPAIRVPTLVLHNVRDGWIDVEEGRYVAARIPGAEFVEFPIEGHITPAADMPPVVSTIERFLIGAWENDSLRQPDRQLATLLFTDIVGSTERMASSATPLARTTRTPPCARSAGARAGARPGGRHRRRWLLRGLRRSGTGGPLREVDRRQRPRPRHRGPRRVPHR